MKIRFNKAIPIGTIIFALACGTMFYVGQQRGIPVDQNMLFVIPMLIVLVTPMLFVNYVVINEKDIVVNSQFGTVSKRYSFNDKSEIEMEGKKIFVNKNGKKEQVRFKGFMASSRDLAELNNRLNQDL